MEMSRQQKAVYEVFHDYFKVEKRFVGWVIVTVTVLVSVLSYICVRNQVWYAGNVINYQITIVWVLPILLYMIRDKYVDMKFSEHNDSSMASLMKYAPYNSKKMKAYCNRKMWLYSVVICIVLAMVDVGIPYWIKKMVFDEAIATFGLEVVYITFLTWVLNYMANRQFRKESSVKRVVIVVAVGIVAMYLVYNLPIVYPVNKTVYGIVGTLEDESYKEAVLVVQGRYKKYLVKDDIFDGIIYSEELGLNVERNEVNLWLYKQGGTLAVFAPSEGYESYGYMYTGGYEPFGYMYTDARFSKVFIQVFDHIEKKENGTSYWHEELCFAGPAQNLEEAQKIAQYFQEKIREAMEQ